VLEKLPLWENSDDFVFDNQMLAQAVFFDFNIGEVSCPTKYFEEASSINFSRSVTYGLGVLETSLRFRLQKLGWGEYAIFNKSGKGLKDASNTYYSDKSGSAGPTCQSDPVPLKKFPG